jgi:hypothetical protein
VTPRVDGDRDGAARAFDKFSPQAALGFVAQKPYFGPAILKMADEFKAALALLGHDLGAEIDPAKPGALIP